MEIQLCYIKKEYFIEHQQFIKMLDPLNFDKQSKRTYLSLKIISNNHSFYVPLRHNLGNALRPYGIIGHSVPSDKRPNAGLDYRYTLIIDDEKYIEKMEELKIPAKQYKTMNTEYETITAEFERYISGFIKALKKGRTEKEPLYRESSLINFKDELLNQ